MYLLHEVHLVEAMIDAQNRGVDVTVVLDYGDNWWIPAWLDRLIPHIDIEGDSALPSPEFEPAEHDGEAPITQEPVLV
ncbi:MAG: hypothetical protein EBY49_08245 [Actinobacteria bacterium]|nr:hypothetical protein [Actinomycetota bacterium]